jgi:hypothetical protein
MLWQCIGHSKSVLYLYQGVSSQHELEHTMLHLWRMPSALEPPAVSSSPCKATPFTTQPICATPAVKSTLTPPTFQS